MSNKFTLYYYSIPVSCITKHIYLTENECRQIIMHQKRGPGFTKGLKPRFLLNWDSQKVLSKILAETKFVQKVLLL